MTNPTDETRLTGDATRLAEDGTRLATSTSGWLSTSGSIDHGRFQPGELLDGRYRVLGLLGRGGMGEVYKADDLRLGQQVALKFLPKSLSQDPVRLAQFHNEVRTARQVSHPNVCRVYDIGEVAAPEGPLLFISMEYVDGEDLAALLKRIGRFPEDKAIDIARQICAGLSAAHDKGILHRDLKPANIMLDSAGRVRLMDFSLASVGTVTDVRAGTPAYMAPEQLQGREVSVRSDIFSLGLVLYELFTGKRVFTATTIGELVQQHETGVTTSVSQVVRTVDDHVDRVISRCLSSDPQQRPVSALAVAAQLQADPLAAALAAGETPSPEMIAAAGGVTATLSGRVAAGLVVLALVGIGASAWLSSRSTILGRSRPTKAEAVLIDRAQTALTTLGHTDAIADQRFGYRHDADVLQWIGRTLTTSDRWSTLANDRPGAIRFWYRTSPQVMVPFDDVGPPGMSDPPLIVSGMTRVVLDGDGRLIGFNAVPRQVEDTAEVAAMVEPNWDAAFALAGLDRTTFSSSTPQWTPLSFADTRRAWTGSFPEWPGQTIRVEAAAYRGRLVMFEIVGPWSRATREVAFQRRQVAWLTMLGSLLVLSLPIGSGYMAYRNWRAGRGDVRGAMKMAVATAVLTMAAWWLMPTRVGIINTDLDRFFMAIGFALFQWGVLFAVYLAVEPFVRRLWPTALISWSRVTTGQWRRDPLVGRDLLIGILAGLFLVLLTGAYYFGGIALGRPEPFPTESDLGSLAGTRETLAAVASRLIWALQNAFISVLLAALLRRRFTSDRVVGLIVALIFTIVTSRTGGAPDSFWIDLALSFVLSATMIAVLMRFGLLATTTMFFVYLVEGAIITTFDSSRIYFVPGLWVMGLLVALIVVGWKWCRADEPLFG